MPDCPKCRARLALTEDGCMCPNCKREFSPEQVMVMHGYEPDIMRQHIELFIVLLHANLIHKGLNEIHYTDEGIILDRKGENF